MTIENRGTERATFWAEYSVQDPEGKWYKGAKGTVTIEPGKRGTIYPGSVDVTASMPRGTYKEIVVLAFDYSMSQKFGPAEHEFEAN
jgi:hypothetical protein